MRVRRDLYVRRCVTIVVVARILVGGLAVETVKTTRGEIKTAKNKHRNSRRQRKTAKRASKHAKSQAKKVFRKSNKVINKGISKGIKPPKNK